jgi:SH3-like domain-containing protein
MMTKLLMTCHNHCEGWRAGPQCARSKAVMRVCAHILLMMLLAGATLSGTAPGYAQARIDLSARKTGPSGLQIPRFVSLKADEVNVRRGPGWDHAVSWVFRRIGLPVEVIAEYDVWRQVRDSEGATGWVLGSLLSGRRTLLIAPWKTDRRTIDILEAANKPGAVRAKVAPGVLGDVQSCDGQWCRIEAGGVTGFISQDQVWGVYPGEAIN